MIELPEAYVLAEQINKNLVGKTIKNAIANAHPHGFAYYSGDPAAYGAMLAGMGISKASADTFEHCGHVDIVCEDMLLSISTPIKYHAPGEKLPKSHQLLLEFTDGSHMSCTIQMWGSMMCCPSFHTCQKKHTKIPSPLSDAFDEDYFGSLWKNSKQSFSAKAFLATEQRIPGLGNGVLQDILFNANIHPKRKLETIGDEEKLKLYHSVKTTLKEMRDLGGRDTEKDLFNQNGGYQTILSKNTLVYPCRICGREIVRKAFLGGNIYFCPVCQPL